MEHMPYKRSSDLSFRAKFRSCDVPDCFKECEIVTVPLFSDINKIISLAERGFNVAVEIPRAFFGMEQKVKEALETVNKYGINDVYCNNIGAVALAREMNFTLHGGFALNIFNTKSIEFYNELGVTDTELSFELTAAQINKLGGSIKRGIIGYGYLPLMIMRNCPNKNGNGCKNCGGKSFITDRKGNNFTMMCSSGCTELINSTPLILSDKLESFKNIDFITLSFTQETKKECEQIYRYYKNKQKPHGQYTRGLYFRGVE